MNTYFMLSIVANTGYRSNSIPCRQVSLSGKPSDPGVSGGNIEMLYGGSEGSNMWRWGENSIIKIWMWRHCSPHSTCIPLFRGNILGGTGFKGCCPLPKKTIYGGNPPEKPGYSRVGLGKLKIGPGNAGDRSLMNVRA